MDTANLAGSLDTARAGQSPARGMRIHVLIVLGIALLSGLLYLPLAQTNYCGFDDTLELGRLSMHDPGTLKDDFRTVTFDTFKYRPLYNTLNRLTFQLGHEGAFLFRVRNIAAHLLICVVIYALGYLLFSSIPIAAATALLFSIHPLTNQTIAGGIWVITPANLCLFTGFLLFVISLRQGPYRFPAMIGCLVIGSIGVLTYDPVIFLYGLMPLYLITWILIERKLPPVSYLAALGGLTLVFLIVWFRLRAEFLPHRAPQITPLYIIVNNILIYIIGVMQVFDPILATDFLGMPLPREALTGESGLSFEWLALIMAPAAIILILLFATMRRWRTDLARRDWLLMACCLVAWAGSLVPYLFFSNHPSETYNYVGLVFLLLIASRMLYAMVTPASGDRRPNLRVFWSVVGGLVLLYGTAVVDRNFRVKSCGSIVGNILRQLPKAELSQGKWDVVFANVPDEPHTRMYGMYGYKGVDTLGFAEYGLPGIPAVLQFLTRNPEISGRVVETKAFTETCATPQPNRACFWVHYNGDLNRVQPGGSAAPPAPQGF